MNAFVRAAKHALIPIADIDITQTTRPYNATVVAALAQSIRAIGLQTPLTCIVRDDKYLLISGLHRLEALRTIGCQEAPVRIVDFQDIEARMWRLSENLHRAELTKLQYDKQVVEYAALLKLKLRRDGEAAAQSQPAGGSLVEERQPEPDLQSHQVGASESRPADEGGESNLPDADGVSRQLGAKVGRPESGNKLAARKLNIPEQTIRRAYQTASLSPEAQKAAEETGLDDNRSALLEAAKAEGPEVQAAVIRRIARRIAARHNGEIASPAKQGAKPLRDLMNISAGELARWIKITTPNDRMHVIRVLEMSAAILRDELGASDADQELDAARAFLETELANGPRNAVDIEARADREGVTSAALARARSRLGVITRQPPGCPRTWRLPKAGESDL